MLKNNKKNLKNKSNKKNKRNKPKILRTHNKSRPCILGMNLDQCQKFKKNLDAWRINMILRKLAKLDYVTKH